MWLREVELSIYISILIHIYIYIYIDTHTHFHPNTVLFTLAIIYKLYNAKVK